MLNFSYEYERTKMISIVLVTLCLKEITDVLLLHDSSHNTSCKHLQIFFEIVICLLLNCTQLQSFCLCYEVFLSIMSSTIEQLITSVPNNYSTTKQLRVLQLKMNSKSLGWILMLLEKPILALWSVIWKF